MRFVNQREHPHMLYVTRTDPEFGDQGKTTTVRSSGCGLCSAIMVLDRLVPNANFSLEDAIALSYETKAHEYIGTSYKRFAPAFAEKFGLVYENTADTDRVLFCLQTGGAVVINVAGDKNGKVGLFSRVGHYVVAINVEPDGRIAVLDPYFQDGRYEIEGRKGKIELKQGVIALCKAEDLFADAIVSSPAYHLFWRA